MGIVLATRDGKYSLKVNKFESAVKNNPSSGVQFWNYGNNLGIYAQAYHQIKYNYETRSQPNSARYGDNIVSDLPVPALIDVDLTPLARARIDRLRATVAAVAPAARVDDHAQWLAPTMSRTGTPRKTS